MWVVAGYTAKMKIFLILVKTLEKQKLDISRSALFHTKTRVSLKYLVNGCRYQGQRPKIPASMLLRHLKDVSFI